jgi:hypothetical protein
MLTLNQIKEELSLSYVHAVSVSSTFQVEAPRIDNDSIDVMIRSKGYLTSESVLSSAELHVQLKATINLNLNAETNEFIFPLVQKNYDELRQPSMVPRILVVLSLPEDQNLWISHGENDLILRSCAYWVSLLGKPASGNETSTTVRIPKANIFSPETIKQLLIKASKQEQL